MKRYNIVLAFSLFFAVTIYKVQGLEIVQPYPASYIVIEGEPLTIPCAAGDANGYPSKVSFKRKSPDGSTYEEIVGNSSVFITNSSHHDTKQGLFITTSMLHLTKTNYPEDGTPNGKSYKCWSSFGQKTDELGFVVYVVQKSSLPTADVQGSGTAVYGGHAELTCNVTYRGNAIAQLNKIMWMRNSTVIGQGSVDVNPITITKATTRDGGEYVCAAELNLKSARTTRVALGSTTLNVQLKMVNGVTEVTVNVTNNVVMECPAEGYPLNVTWFRVNRQGQEVRLGDVPRIKDRAIFSRPCSYCRYNVMIMNLQEPDQGHYVCRANTNTESARHHIDLYVRMESNSNDERTTVMPTTEEETERVPLPSPFKLTMVHMAIYITLGIMLGISLLINGCLFYKLLRNKKHPDETDIHEDIEIVTEPAKDSSTLELEPLVETNTDNTDKLGVNDANDSGSMTKERELGTEKDSEVEGKCSSQCDSMTKDTKKYAELPQNEAENTKMASNHHDGACSLM